MRTCRTCGETKPLDEFDLRADTGKRRSVCKSCRRAAQRIATPNRAPRTLYVVGAAEMLRCRKCLELKAWTEFPRRGLRTNRLQTWCKQCFSAYKAQRHQMNHQREMVRIRRNHANQIATDRARANDYLLAHPCVDCGESDIIVLEFDHVRGVKLHDVSKMIANGYPWRRIDEEIAKCEVRCANCHRRVTAQRRKERTIGEPVWIYGDPGAIRTRDQQLRRLLL